MNWTYKGQEYTTVPLDWDSISNSISGIEGEVNKYYPNVATIEDPNDRLCFIYRVVFYHKRWNKCYTLETYGRLGNGNRIKICLIDIYKRNRLIYGQAKDVELVIKK